MPNSAELLRQAQQAPSADEMRQAVKLHNQLITKLTNALDCQPVHGGNGKKISENDMVRALVATGCKAAADFKSDENISFHTSARGVVAYVEFRNYFQEKYPGLLLQAEFNGEGKAATFYMNTEDLLDNEKEIRLLEIFTLPPVKLSAAPPACRSKYLLQESL